MRKAWLGAIAVVLILVGATVLWVMVGTGGSEGFESVDGFLDLTSDQESYLEDHMFVVVDGSAKGFEAFQAAYKELNDDDVPVIVTTDCMLHQYHVFFDNTLKGIEEEELYHICEDMSRDLMLRAEEQFGTIEDPWLFNASEGLVTFFAVPLRLLNPDAEVPGHVEDVVSQELALIEAHAGFSASPVFATVSGDHLEDYSQYVPRGHYTRSEALERYFKAMMWYGRQTFYNKSLEETAMAVLAVLAFDEADDGPATPWDAWERIYEVTELFVGESDDLMPTEYAPEVEDIFGDGGPGYTRVADRALLEGLRQRVGGMRPPTILSTLMDQGEDLEAQTKGMRIMGQRWIPDSYMFTNLVHSKVPGRSFPTGMDVLNVLGVERAAELMEGEEDAYPQYGPQVAKLRDEFDDLAQEDWEENLYMGWMDTLTALHQDFAADDDYPEFMRDPAWSTQKLSTHMGSWTELRHDTILYAKQSYTERGAAGPTRDPEERGYVEPIRGFYPRLRELVEDTKARLDDLDVLSVERAREFDDLIEVIQRLSRMVDRELDGDGLTDEDLEWLRSFGARLVRLNSGLDDDDQKTVMVADVHTDPNTGKVLEEGVGYVDFLVVKVQGPKGDWRYCVGPVFSYYEFQHPMSDRLTDEAWEEMLQEGEAPERPWWTEEFLR